MKKRSSQRRGFLSWQSDATHERARWRGAPIPVPAPFPTSQWAFEAPKIASLSGWMAEDAVRLLQTGSSAKGYVPRPPMPPFRMTQEDAAAVVAYLKSLP